MLKLRLESESTPTCSYTTSSYTNLEPIQANSPSIEGSSSKALSEISSSIPEMVEFRISSDEDNDLSRYTPRSRLRQIEEHGQYDASRDHDRKFKCQYCHKRFVRKEEKLRHERSHTNDRKYKCRSKFSIYYKLELYYFNISNFVLPYTHFFFLNFLSFLTGKPKNSNFL